MKNKTKLSLKDKIKVQLFFFRKPLLRGKQQKSLSHSSRSERIMIVYLFLLNVFLVLGSLVVFVSGIISISPLFGTMPFWVPTGVGLFLYAILLILMSKMYGGRIFEAIAASMVTLFAIGFILSAIGKALYYRRIHQHHKNAPTLAPPQAAPIS